MPLLDRRPNFYRLRQTQCAACGHRQDFDDDWLERWACGGESCPGCGVDSSAEAATQVVEHPADLALDDGKVPTLSWWHTSTHSDWPSEYFDPAASLDEATRLRMGGDTAVARWAARQRARALHIGTYEAAVHNMFRRIHDQSGAGETFFLYRVTLRTDIVLQDGCGPEVVDFMGDAALSDVCAPGIDAVRYVNAHEDPGSISLALGRSAIEAVQGIRVPTPTDIVPAWHSSAVERLLTASTEPVEITEPDNALTRLQRRRRGPAMTTEREQVQMQILHEATAHLPANLIDSVRHAIPIDPAADPVSWSSHLAATVQLIDAPEFVVRTARRAPHRPIAAPSEKVRYTTARAK